MFMRHQTCITLDLETHQKIREKLKDIKFRSKSHLIECAIVDFLKNGEENE